MVALDLGDVLGVGTKFVVDVLVVDTQLVVYVARCCQFPPQHAQLCPFLHIVQREL